MITMTSKASLIALRKEQYAAFYSATPGSEFDRVTGLIQSFDGEKPVLALSLDDDRSAAFTKDGERAYILEATGKLADDGTAATRKKVVELDHRGWCPEILGSVVPGAAPVAAEVNGMRFASGLTIVAGPGSVGKTPFLHALAGEMDSDYATIRFGEPLAGYNSDFDELIRDLANALLDHRVVVVDSFKDVIAAAGGTTASGGLSRGAFKLFSDLGAAAATRGNIILVSVNPTASDSKVMDLLYEAARSNSTSLVTTSDGSTFTAYTRTGEGLMRIKNDIETYYDQNVMMIRSVGTAGVKRSTTTKLNTTVTHNELEAALSRMNGE